MCFLIREDYTAEEDMVCFKVLKIEEDGTIRSPYFHKKWELGREEVQKLNSGKVTHHGSSGESVIERYTIDGLYTCVDKKSAKLLLRVIKSRTNVKLRIFKCVIPKGSKYFIGLDELELCSEKLIIKRQLIFNLI
jgi:hypothetical protein